MTILFHKVHGSGNTFYLHEEEVDHSYDWPMVAVKMCDPAFENGADGLLIISASSKADARMRVYNADGSEASMCGNGLRCAARYVLNKLKKSRASIETMKAVLNVSRVEPIFEEIETYSVEISPVSFELSTLPMVYGERSEIVNEVLPEFSSDIKFTAISVPNPHLIGVVPIQYIKDTKIQEQLASSFNSKNAYFSDGVNVSFVHPVDRESIFVRTFERGVGFTNACGTAMTASALVAASIGLVPFGEVKVYNPGGFVTCSVKKTGEGYQLKLIGNATIVASYSGEIDHDGEFLITSYESHHDEIESYQKMEQAAKEILEYGLAN